MRTAQLRGGAGNNAQQRRRQAFSCHFPCRDGASGLSLLGMKSPAQTALKFCRRCLLWGYAEISAAQPNIVFEDLDPRVVGTRFDFTNQSVVMSIAAGSLPRGFILNVRAVRTMKYAVTVENDSVDPPIVLADNPVESDDMCVAIMEACIEAVRKQREAV
jgi:hypothetical protein